MKRVIPVFIASPGDVQAERDIVYNAINDLSSKLQPIYDIVLHPVRWEQFTPLTTATEEEAFQDRIIKRLEACAIFIGVIYRRYGTEIDVNRKFSGTESEFRFAIEHRRDIKILTYFREQSRDSINNPDRLLVEQLYRLDKLKDDLKKHGVAFQNYHNVKDFSKRIILDLLETVLEMITETARRDCLKSFFKLGIAHNRTQPSVMIGYPAIHKHHGSSAQAVYDWQERLVPNVVYEDHKAIQKIEAALRYLGVMDYSSVTIDHPKLKLINGNRIWLCLPRNEMAQKALKRLGGRAWFRFEGNSPESRCIIWRPNGSKKEIHIHSPLDTYLAHQRPKARRAWEGDFGFVYARDFAIISRFKLEDEAHANKGTPFYEYFIAGIRGLGTWGVGWFIDRQPDSLKQLTELQGKGDIQALLQVTYENYRIINVKNVSTFDQKYFDEQNDSAFISKIVEDRKPL